VARRQKRGHAAAAVGLHRGGSSSSRSGGRCAAKRVHQVQLLLLWGKVEGGLEMELLQQRSRLRSEY
jgi:hypothetical protein